MAVHRHAGSRVLLLLLSALVVVVVLAGRPVFRSARVYWLRSATAARFQHIQVAMECYRQNHGSYPPQYLADRQGRPAHSWRVLLLEFTYPDLYRRYHFDEPWDGPHNRLLAPEMPEDYRSPFVDAKSTTTQYVGIAGKQTPWRGTTPMREGNLRRGVSNPLIWFVEAANSDINWMEPRDIPFEQATVGINVAGGGGIQSNYADGLPAQMKPFGCEWVPSDISPERFRAMLTIPDAEEKAPKKVPAADHKRLSPDMVESGDTIQVIDKLSGIW